MNELSHRALNISFYSTLFINVCRYLNNVWFFVCHVFAFWYDPPSYCLIHSCCYIYCCVFDNNNARTRIFVYVYRLIYQLYLFSGFSNALIFFHINWNDSHADVKQWSKHKQQNEKKLQKKKSVNERECLTRLCVYGVCMGSICNWNFHG